MFIEEEREHGLDAPVEDDQNQSELELFADSEEEPSDVPSTEEVEDHGLDALEVKDQHQSRPE